MKPEMGVDTHSTGAIQNINKHINHTIAMQPEACKDKICILLMHSETHADTEYCKYCIYVNRNAHRDTIPATHKQAEIQIHYHCCTDATRKMHRDIISTDCLIGTLHFTDTVPLGSFISLHIHLSSRLVEIIICRKEQLSHNHYAG